ncbi:MAG: transporter, partial [Planctomycetes bacterium]|nr:transporter [Planctomycetota bacterium]
MTFGGGGIPLGKYESAEPWFIIPEFGINWMLDEDSSIGFALNANGGMNTEYGTNPFRNFGTNIDPVTPRTGIDMAQALLGLTYAHKFGAHSIGVTPTVAFQYFSAYGLEPFQGISSDPSNITNRGYDYSAGYGLRLGYQGNIGDDLTLGAAYQSRMYMQKFDKYKGLFADGGSFDIAPTISL